MGNGAESDLAGHFRAGWETLLRHPVLLVPPLAVGVVAIALLVLLGGGTALIGALMGGMVGGGDAAAAGGIVGLLAGVAAFLLAVGVLSMASSGMVVVMAKDALAGRDPNMGDAMGLVATRLWTLLVAGSLASLAVGVGLLLFVIPGLVIAVFLVFTMPAVLLDAHGATDAIRRSVAIVRANPGPVVGFVVGAILVTAAVGVAGWILAFVPFLGGLAAMVLHVAALSYLTLVAVRLYQALPGHLGSGLAPTGR